ncbi:MAG: YqgE/AlgH family protein [Gaiellales bacterium]
MDGESLKGHLLIAAPMLVDPNFRRTVVLLLEHGEEGALGVVLNRPSQTSAEEAVPDLAGVLGEGDPIFLGGPVQPGTVIALADFTDPTAVDDGLCGSIASLEFGADPEEIAGQVSRARVFAGYAGWGEGQLEDELEEEAWFTEPALPGDVFDPDPTHLWGRVLERKGREDQLVARMPDDPRWN